MKKILTASLILTGIFILAGCNEGSEEAAIIPSSEHIMGTNFISASGLKTMIDANDEDFVLIGVLNGTKAMLPTTMESKPIDGTFRVWRGDYSGTGSLEAISPNVGGFRFSKEDMEVLLSKAGITDNSKIVVYSTDNMHDSTRFYWQLKLLGHNNVHLLDGGLNAWVAAGYETGDSITLANLEPVNDYVAHEYNTAQWNASIEDVVNALENPDEWVVIDTRSTGEYNGEKTGSSGGAFGTGALKGAIHIGWEQALNEDKTLKSVEELTAIYGDIIEGKNVITFCQSGVRSSHTQIILLEMLGATDVHNYDGSWIEWSYAASEASTDVDADLKAKVLSLTDKWEDNKKEI